MSSTLNLDLRRSWLCWLVVFVMQCHAQVDFGSDTISRGQELKNWQILSSANKVFRLQFSFLSYLERRYLAIYVYPGGSEVRVDTPVWIGNRDNTIYDTSGSLMINGTDGMLYIKHSRGSIYLPGSSSTGYRNINTSATLQNDGNLVLREVYPNGSVSGTLLWQSFDHPTHTLLPGMKLGMNLKTGQQWFLTSWISYESPASGSFTLGVNKSNTNQLIIWWNKEVFWTSGLSHQGPFGKLPIHVEKSGNEEYFTLSQTDGAYTAIILSPDGTVTTEPLSDQQVHCDISPEVYQPGCVKYSWPDCVDGHTFSESKPIFNGVLSIREDNNNLNIIDCQAKCMQNCSCYAYASLYSEGTGCEFWDKEAMGSITGFNSMQKSVYTRHNVADKASKRTKRWWIWLITVCSGTSFLLLSIIYFVRNHRVKDEQNESENLLPTTSRAEQMTAHEMLEEKDEKQMSQFHRFRFETIEMATNNFSMENKLGQGGFGPVYKGKLLDGQEIAVKKLSRNSSQGIMEFKNEIQLIVNLQHKNLVGLLGCCIHGEEMMLVYEYMPNKSLNFFLFDPTKRKLLTWTHRMNIIEGIAQGLLYLHKHSRLMVIHRDLKASNILLDQNMAPKISDFGMARIFGMEDSEANTERIVGTYGYMSPEYAINGIVSTKTDVFSFGVLILEIVSGKKNNSKYHSERPFNLIELVWESWAEGKALELVDETMDVSNKQNEIQRCINVGLLCVQDSPNNRPSMTDVIFMLKNETSQLPIPRQPSIFIETSTKEKDIAEDLHKNCTNELSISIMEAR